MIALELADATRRYGRRTALDSVRLVVRAGSAVGLLGPNGAGKTTALRLLLGFARPTSGAARLQGRDPFDPRAREGVGYLPERLSLPRGKRLRAFLRLHAALAGLAGAARDAAIEETLERTGLADRADEPLGTLSRGLAQRVGFAQALLAAPRLLLLDEPTTGLDPLGVRAARTWLAEAHAAGATLLVSSHVLSEVERLCDHVAIVHRGRLVASGPLESVLEAGESLEDAFVRLVGS